MAIILPSDIKHIIVEVITKNDKILVDPTVAKELAIKIAGLLKSDILEETYKKFDNGAYTFMAVLSTSHIVINTYPEKRYLDIDLAWCSDVDFNESLFSSFIENNLSPIKYNILFVDRKLAREI